MAGAILVGVVAFALARRRQRSWALMPCSIRPACHACHACHAGHAGHAGDARMQQRLAPGGQPV